MGIITDARLLDGGLLTDRGKLDFIEDVADKMLFDGAIDLKLGSLSFPLASSAGTVSVSGNQAAADFFYRRSPPMTADEHQEMYPAYHNIFLGIYEQLLNLFDLEAKNVLKPLGLFDPTIPIKIILDFVIEVSEEILAFIGSIPDFLNRILSSIMTAAAELIAIIVRIPIDTIDAILELIEFILNLGIELGLFSISIPDILEKIREAIKERIQEIVDKIKAFLLSLIPRPDFSPLVPEFFPQTFPDGFIRWINSLVPDFPSPPFPIDFDFRLNLPFELGLVDWAFELIQALIGWIQDVIQNIVQFIADLFAAIARGIAALIEFIVEFILTPIITLLLKFAGFANLMVVSIITLVERTLGLIIASLVGFLLGDGLILKGVLSFFDIG